MFPAPLPGHANCCQKLFPDPAMAEMKLASRLLIVMQLLFDQLTGKQRRASTYLQAIKISILSNGSLHLTQVHQPTQVNINGMPASNPFHTRALRLHSMQALYCVHIASIAVTYFAKWYILSIVQSIKNAPHNCCPIHRCCHHSASN